MDRNYIAFIIAYDYCAELENLDLACDEGFEFALYLADSFKDFCVRNGWEESYDSLRAYCDEAISFKAMLYNMRGYVDEPRMKKYIVNVVAHEYGFVEIEAKTEKEACSLALESEAEGMINWGDSEILINSVEEVEA
jgi:hypothetical protein